MNSRTLTKDMLVRPVEIQLDAEPPDFLKALEIADAKASELLDSPMLLAWWNGTTGEHSPKVE